MEFPQQIEETLVERPSSAYDVVMESPLYASLERKRHVDKMGSSMNSTLEDTTPSDSGVQLLDSESSLIESITSQTAFDLDDNRALQPPPQTQTNLKDIQPVVVRAAEETTAVVDSNSNVTTVSALVSAVVVEDAMTTSQCSTFDTADNIVYRRKTRKTAPPPKAPKKRVSFHEDILKNTRTDNIHIEHGFITYKSGGRKLIPSGGVAGRYSWCSEGDAANKAGPTELCAQLQDGGEEGGQGGGRGVGGAGGGCGGGGPGRSVVYRNACSDVLDYGNSDIYDTNETTGLQYDNSGVFEYVPKKGNNGSQNGCKDGEQKLYKCSCSSSNSSLDSDENDKNSNRQQYGQAKSSSCDCIGMNNANNNFIGENCYFSDPNIDNINESPRQKSVWNKEKKPKSSCLKKSKCHTNIIQEQDLSSKVKKFNVHDMNQLLDNSSKMIFGSLKSIFTMPLPERGVPEGSEDLQAVIECVPELEQTPEHKPLKAAPPDSPPLRQKPFLSKSLDGSKQQPSVKKFVHNVDEQLRRKNDDELFAPTRQSSAEQMAENKNVLRRQEEVDSEAEGRTNNAASMQAEPQMQFRNKFIINCESTVFEHTGVSYSYESSSFGDATNMNSSQGSVASMASLIEKDTPIGRAEPDQLRNAFISAPIAKTFSNFFRSFKESPKKLNKQTKEMMEARELQLATENYFALKMSKQPEASTSFVHSTPTKTTTTLTTPSTISESTTKMSNHSTTNGTWTLQKSSTSQSSGIASVSVSSSSHRESLVIGQDARGACEKQTRHLSSPLKKRTGGSGVGQLLAYPQQRYGVSVHPAPDPALLSPDLFNSYQGLRGGSGGGSGSGRDSKSTILSEEFDDILTITTDTDKNESDIVIVDYAEVNDRPGGADYANLLKPPQPAAKTSLINRFLRNVTQKKIMESSMRRNNFFAHKLRAEQRLFTDQLYVRGAKPRNLDLIDDLNAEIAMEIEMSGVNSPRRELISIESDCDLPGDVSRFELGIGEISVDVFAGVNFNILRDPTEQLMKVFKLYTGYSPDGFMTPVLVFLTDKTLYVTDLVRNRLCSKFVLAYVDLDVILMGPYGNTVLLSNNTRDMQQVLLAGGPYPADGLVANLELCARRSGSTLPSVGQLTLDHLAPLQAFVRENSCVDKQDAWMYYAVVNVPGSALGGAGEQEPLGPHVKGFLMHRRVREHAGNSKQPWNPGYFLLKAGVLYMFNDSSQKLPSWAMALAECQGARRVVKAARPHCFEIMLRDKMLLQLAAPDEYVASEWLQALLQAASGLFEMQEKHKTLGCTLVVTQNHLITLREDFSAPLRKLNKAADRTEDPNAKTVPRSAEHEMSTDLGDKGHLLSSVMSTPTRDTQRSCSSVNSTPSKLSQLSRSTASCNTMTSKATSSAATSTSASTLATTTHSKGAWPRGEGGASYTSMSSVYGKNSGLEILTCADIKEMIGIKIPSHNDTWWCILEFSCQEVRECSDDLVIFFASSTEMQRFLRLLEQLWQAKHNDLFPIAVLDEDDVIAEQCTMLHMDINRSWEPLLSAALGYPL